MFGDVVGTQSFFPFGEVHTGTGLFDTERGFTGQIADVATGLNFYNARYQSLPWAYTVGIGSPSIIVSGG